MLWCKTIDKTSSRCLAGNLSTVCAHLSTEFTVTLVHMPLGLFCYKQSIERGKTVSNLVTDWKKQFYKESCRKECLHILSLILEGFDAVTLMGVKTRDWWRGVNTCSPNCTIPYLISWDIAVLTCTLFTRSHWFGPEMIKCNKYTLTVGKRAVWIMRTALACNTVVCIYSARGSYCCDTLLAIHYSLCLKHSHIAFSKALPLPKLAELLLQWIHSAHGSRHGPRFVLYLEGRGLPSFWTWSRKKIYLRQWFQAAEHHAFWLLQNI